MALNRRGTSTCVFPNMPVIVSAASVVGPREGKGPLGPLFDLVCGDTLCGEVSWEKAETKMLRQATDLAVAKAGLQDAEIDFFLAGDLLNQIISSSFTARDKDIPFLGLYGACSTIGEAMAIGSFLIHGGFASNVLVASSSHHDTAERQYRYPTEFGYQRVPSSQWTVTAAAALVLSSQGEGPKVEAVTVGRVLDFGITDANDMGSAMAPAFADTVWRHLSDLGRTPDDYDAIFSGDLGRVGSKAALHLLKQRGIDLSRVHEDTGLMIYNMEPEICSGASGCGCVASVFAAKIYPELKSGQMKRVLLVPTGALHSPTTCQQDESIPSIAHAISLVYPGWEEKGS